jgi:pimeloyl-ACP methyl ester carboxylesterase
MKTSQSPRIAFDDFNDGDDALLLMPGWCGPRTLYRPLYSHLAQRTIAVDWRGHGGSEMSGDFGYAELAGDLERVLDQAGVERVIPVGIAHAGWAAIDLRRALGDRVPGVVLIDWMVLGAPPPFFDALTALQGDRWAETRDRLFAMWTTGVTEPAVHAYVRSMAESDREMWARAGREIERRFRADPMPLAMLEGCPTLHLYAQPADPAFLAAQQDFATSHPWFEVHRVSAASHFPMLEAPGEVASHVARFASRWI